MFYTGMALLFLAIISLVWLVVAFIRKTNKKIPGIVFALSLIGFIVVVTITGTTSDTANQNTVPSVSTSNSSTMESTTSNTEKQNTAPSVSTSNSSTAESTTATAEENDVAKKNDEILKTTFDDYNDGNYMDATGAEVLTNDDGSIKYVQLNVNDNWKDLSKDEQEKYIDLLKAISGPFKDGETYPYMQIQSDGKLVARSTVQDTPMIDIVNE